MKLEQYEILARWDARIETPEMLAARFIQLIDRLAPLHPFFSDWIWVSMKGEPTMFESRRPRLVQAVTDNVTRDDWDEADPDDGYFAGVVNTYAEATPKSLSVGASGGSKVNANRAYIRTGRGAEPDPSVVTYEVFKSALLALAEIYDVDWCMAFPDDIRDLWPRAGLNLLAWMWYIRPEWVPLITPPKTAIVEHRPNGALFISATTDTFITANPAHLAVARDIEKALAPLNDLKDKSGF